MTAKRAKQVIYEKCPGLDVVTKSIILNLIDQVENHGKNCEVGPVLCPYPVQVSLNQ